MSVHEEFEEVRQQAAKMFVLVNQITMGDIHQSRHIDRQTIKRLDDFILWLKHGPYRRFVEWNDRIYFTTDILNNHMRPTPATIHDVPK